jgi:hypothetical protein
MVVVDDEEVTFVVVLGIVVILVVVLITVNVFVFVVGFGVVVVVVELGNRYFKSSIRQIGISSDNLCFGINHLSFGNDLFFFRGGGRPRPVIFKVIFIATSHRQCNDNDKLKIFA